MMKVVLCVLVFVAALVAPVQADDADGDTDLPRGILVGGVVDDDGETLILMRRSSSPGDGSFIVRMVGNRVQVIDLPEMMVKTMTPLSDGHVLLWSLKGPFKGGYGVLAYDIVKLHQRGQLDYIWSLGPEYGLEYGMHPPGVSVSGDGKVWGISEGGNETTFVFGKTSSSTITRSDMAMVSSGAATDRWPMGPPDFVFLDSDGPVVLLPQSKGAYIIRFSEGTSSPHIQPFLVNDAEDEEYEYRWQWKDSVLWVRTSRDWKAYGLWNLDVLPEEPFWVVENSGSQSAIPHHERGLVKVFAHGETYRVEHVWRDPWSHIEERRVSDWQDGLPFRSLAGGVRKHVYVSPHGGRVVVVGADRSDLNETDDSTYYVRRLSTGFDLSRPVAELVVTEPID